MASGLAVPVWGTQGPVCRLGPQQALCCQGSSGRTMKGQQEEPQLIREGE